MKNITFKDFHSLRKNLKIAFWLSKKDLKIRYSKTLLGPFWTTIIFGITIVILGPLYQSLFNLNQDYILDLTIGLFFWRLFNDNIIESTRSFKSHYFLYDIKNLGISFPTLKTCISNFLIFIHQTPVLIVIFFYVGEDYFLKIFICFVLLFFFSIYLYPINFIISLFSLRYKDIESMLISVMTILFFTSPIIWPIDILPENKKIFLEFNPVYYYIEFIRDLSVELIFNLKFFLILSIIYIMALLIMHYLKIRIKNRFLFWLV